MENINIVIIIIIIIMWICLVTRGQQGSSSESLANRLRPGVSTSTKITTSPGSSGGGGGGSVGGIGGSGSKHPKSSTFQEELMRLIDPDVSLAELENSINKVTELIWQRWIHDL